jgi:hypothetical protein
MAMTLNLRADRELWKYIYLNFPFARSFHLSMLPDYNQVWAEQLYREDPIMRPELLTPRHQRIIKAIERQAKAMGFISASPARSKKTRLIETAKR